MAGMPRGSCGSEPSSAHRRWPPSEEASDVRQRPGDARRQPRGGTGPAGDTDGDWCADPGLFQLTGVYRADSGEDGYRTASVPLGGFLDRIAEAIIRAGAAAG